MALVGDLQPGLATMTLARPVFPGRFYMVTRSCTQRQYVMRPDKETNENYLYCLAEAAQRFDITVLQATAMSNHHHPIIYDRWGLRNEFTERMHQLFARSQNCLRGRRENLWASEQVNLVELVDVSDVIDKIVYSATNPVQAGLVEKVHHWPGVNTLSALLEGRTIKVKRPRFFFRADGPMPEEIELRVALPPELGDPAPILDAIRRKVAQVEERMAAKRRETGARVLGRRGVLAQSWKDTPSTPRERRDIRPQIAARDTWRRLEAIQRNRDFLRAYREARERLIANDPIPFPPGTYWLRRFANVPIANLPIHS